MNASSRPVCLIMFEEGIVYPYGALSPVYIGGNTVGLILALMIESNLSGDAVLARHAWMTTTRRPHIINRNIQMRKNLIIHDYNVYLEEKVLF